MEHPNSNRLEIYEPEEPAPLRIIKRSQTVAGRPSSSGFGGADEWGVFESTFVNEDEGSPPIAANRPLGPLTIHKIRRGRGKGRGSILGDSLSIKVVDVEKQVYPEFPKDDFDLTPKATRQPERAVSAGKFLRTELHRGSSENDVNRYPIQQPLDGSPEIPKRKHSKSKYSLLRAFGGKRSDDLNCKALGRSDSSASTRTMKSQNTLLRRLSHRKSTASTIQSIASSVPSSFGTVELTHPFDTNSQEIIDATVSPRECSYYDGTVIISSPPTPTLGSSRDDNLVLCPQISVTPESASVNAGVCTLWAAVEITGVLRRADGTSTSDDAGRTYSTQNLTPRCLDLRSYGSLHNIAVEFQPGPDCIIVDQPEDTFQAKTIRVSETHLMLVKIRLSEVKVSVSHAKEKSSDELIENLNEILGDISTQYLTVKLNYRHSAFLNLRQQAVEGEFRLLPQHTLLETKATASIKRHNPASAWSPRNSGAMNSAVGGSALTKIIEKHFSAEKSREALQKLADDRTTIPYPRRTYGHSSDKENRKSTASPLSYIDPSNSLLSHSFSMTAISNFNARGSPVPKRLVSPYDHPLDMVDGEMDPARKIWSQMRRTSRPARKHPRASISDGNYFSADQDALFDCTPRYGGSLRSPNTSLFEPPDSHFDTSLEVTPKAKQNRASRGKSTSTVIDDNRNQLMEVALRNKRSVGQETLRSMVPSTHSGKGFGIGRQGGVMGAVAGVGLAGRNWGQWLPWGGGE
ncbi:1f7dc8b9-b6ef-4b00-a03f-3888a3dd88f1 [Sclerotinia trifoliorum]|uniref:1f7dc8b9-b6ef-4b00-a03f-3888a3dd88f1 n=1 Tax=Sclerotinia trifoliorum TaxID=28548 RepID=A0A8H2VXC1_9HELO|nr:1f7dc8b9-b6ef-4b00-a03f-3888a3dd88f1 [Sclerotinia trifoliorum]